jgi:hypothetical protein
LFLRNIRWEIVLNNSKFLVGIKSSFVLLNEHSHSAINMITVSAMSSRGFRSLSLFSAMVVCHVFKICSTTHLITSSPGRCNTTGDVVWNSFIVWWC